MKNFYLVPHGWCCTLDECPPGVFYFRDSFGFKDEYSGEGDVYCLLSGEIFWGGTHSKEERGKLIVQPVILEEKED